MIKLITGPMRSGKSLILLREAEKLHLSKESYVILRPPGGKRDFISRSFKPTLDLNVQFLTHTNQIRAYENILVDEFHLLEEHYIPYLIEESIKNKRIILSGLLSGSDNSEAPNDLMLLKNNIEILPFVNKIIKTSSVCESCGSKFGNLEYTKKETITIGDDYHVYCLDCAKDKINHKYLTHYKS